MKKSLLSLLRNERGLTLVELLIGLAILTIVLSVGYTFYFYGYNTFKVGESRSYVRQYTRLSADFITQELRYASYVKICNTIPGDGEFDPGFKYIYVKDNILKHRDFIDSDGSERTVLDAISDGIVLENLELHVVEDDILQYKIKNGEDDDYEIETKVKILNLPSGDQIHQIGSGDKILIAYKSDRPTITKIASATAEWDGNNLVVTLTYTTPLMDDVSGLAKSQFSFQNDNSTVTPNNIMLEGNDSLKLTFDNYNFRSGGNRILTYTQSETADERLRGASNAYVISPDEVSIGVPENSFLDPFVKFIIDENVFVYGTQFTFLGGQVNGPNATTVIKGDLITDDLNGGAFSNVTYIYIDGSVELDGGSAGLGSSSYPGRININGNLYLGSGQRHIYGDVYVAGDFYLKDAQIHGNVYVTGNLELDWTPWLADDAHIYYTGTFTHPPTMSTSITSKCIKQDSVPSVEMPDFPIPPMKPNSWYAERGYVPQGALVDEIKIFAEGDYTFTKYIELVQNVIIVSKGDITIKHGGINVTGVLYAPYGKVTFEGSSFEGLVISRDGFFVTSGGTEVTFRSIDNYIPDPNDYPF